MLFGIRRCFQELPSAGAARSWWRSSRAQVLAPFITQEPGMRDIKGPVLGAWGLHTCVWTPDPALFSSGTLEIRNEGACLCMNVCVFSGLKFSLLILVMFHNCICTYLAHDKIHITFYHFNHFKVYSSVVLTAFTLLYTPYLVLELFHHSERKPHTH